ncbi:periplasmic chaperone for outer membrane proteins Skp [Lacibacter cauensis]|uniref:Periplasmic chaperone for outer membrane proteins Skp n=1 Tax=Lacibacter cauensis TaxID=510947 RepID=A0A562SYE0_9BACT|nr:OmpH family outer membrane protein [Lacibacter cauensis]TWI85736.1 periplasmic chaperone for outer membrane proteins Skp [Lacibacter cauensis]
MFIISSVKIGYVDSSKLLNEYKAMIQARSEFEKKQAGWRSNMDTLTAEVKSAISKYEQLTISGSASEKQVAKELISTKQKQLYDYQNTIRQNAQQEEQKLTQSVLATVNSFLLSYGKKNGYKLILIAANGNIAYAEPSMDITNKIVEALNKEYATPAK